MKFKNILLILIAFVLVGCVENEVEGFTQLLEGNLIELSDEERLEVTEDFGLITKFKDITISWESSNTDVIIIEINKAIVTRSARNEYVQLTANFEYNNVQYSRKFLVVIVKADYDPNPNINKNYPEINIDNELKFHMGTEIDIYDYVEAYDEKDGFIPVQILVNNINVNVPGSYKVVASVTNSKSYNTTTEFYVEILEKELANTCLEDFSKLNERKSQYRSFVFAGNNSISWTISGSRDDVDLDGNALTFGGRQDDNSSIKATFPNGISHLSFDARQAFTANVHRELGVYINGELVKTYVIPHQDTVNILTHKIEVDVNTHGSTEVEIKSINTTTARAQISIDNIMITDNPTNGMSLDELKVYNDFSSLKIEKKQIMSGNIHLPNQGENGSNITWSYKNDTNPDNELVDLINSKVTVLENESREVKILATLELGGFTYTKPFTIFLSEGEALDIKEVLNKEEGNKVKVTGIVSSKFSKSSGVEFYLQDLTAGILVKLDLDENIYLGDVLEIFAIVNKDSNGVYLSEIKKLTKLRTEAVTPIEVESVTLEDLDGKLVKLNGLLQSSSLTDNAFTIINEQGEFNVYLNPALINYPTLKGLLNGKATGLEVDVTGNVIDENTIALTSINNITLEESVNNLRLSNIILIHLNFPTEGQIVKHNLNFFVTSTLFENLTIEWETNFESVINQYGIIYPQEDDHDVMITFSLYIDDELISSNNINVIVAMRGEFSDYYATIEGLTGNDLISELNRIISNMVTLSYQSTSYILEQSDLDLTKTDMLLLIYSRTNTRNIWQGGSNWNKEHVWPQSKLGSASVSDIHNLRAANPGVNSSRGNDAFANGTGSYKHVSGGFYPGDGDKGDVARIIFYMNIRWGLAIDSQIGNLEMFKAWHFEDPVDDFEIHRNEVLFEAQENRNPFIDHPELVEIIYGSVILDLNYSEEVNNYHYLDNNLLYLRTKDYLYA